MNQLASRLLQQHTPEEGQKDGFFRRFAQSFGLASNG